MNHSSKSQAQLAPLSQSPRQDAMRHGDVRALSAHEIDTLLKDLDGNWQVAFGHHLSGCYEFDSFGEALDFAGRVGALSIDMGNAPNITLGEGRAEISLYTQDIDGLSEKDFAIASAISRLKEK